MRVPCPREGGHQCCVAAQCPAIGSGAGSGCAGEPLLHDLAFGSYGLARHADPGALNHFRTSGAGPARERSSANWAARKAIARVYGHQGPLAGQDRLLRAAYAMSGNRCFCKAVRAISGFGLEEAHISGRA